jgi:hypothetical protein
MHITFQKVKSVLYFSFWVVIVMGILMMWFHFFGDYMYEYALPLVCGCTVGILSGLSPGRTFLTCFCGFFIISAIAVLTIPNSLRLFQVFTLLGIFCGLIGLASAVVRKAAFRSRLEQLHLPTWQWAILIGGASVFCDFLLIPGSYTAVIQFHFSRLFAEMLLVVLIGVAGLGLYAGAFYDIECHDLIRNVLKFSLGGHAVFLLYFVFRLATGHIFWRDSFFFPVMAMILTIVIVGTKIGYRFRKSLWKDMETKK